MLRKTYIFLSVICLLLFTSCESIKYLTIDVMKPGELIFPPTIANVALVDNGGARLDSITEKEDMQEIEVTSKSKTIFIESLAQFLTEENYFNEIKLYPNPIRKDVDYDRQGIVPRDTLIKIGQSLGVDAIISMDKFHLSSKPSSWMTDTRLDVVFRLYNSKGDLIGPLLGAKDSLLWAGNLNGRPNEELYNLEVGEKIALTLSEKTLTSMVPYWEQQSRQYYIPGYKTMKEAHKYAEKGKWAEAAKLWGQAFELAENDKQKAKIAANIALANESLDDMENAVTWIKIAASLILPYQDTDEYAYIMWYQVQLVNRLNDQPVLRRQLGITGNQKKEE